uniref:Uncharacterized protein n=1 Tax=Romanomermis culicivorax TaxID=13658 RepID=A0A915JLZ9_ROMCU
CHSGFGADSLVGFVATTAEIGDAGQCEPVNDTKNDWRCQRNRVVSTDGRHTGASSLGLRILGTNVAQQALKFIAEGTIRANPVDKILLDREPSLPAVNAVGRAVEQASHNARPTAVVAVSLSMKTTGAQTLVAIAQQQSVGAAKLLPPVANAFGETLHAINDDLSVIEVSPFPTATVLGPPKIGVLRKVHPEAWSSTSPARNRYRLTTTA